MKHPLRVRPVTGPGGGPPSEMAEVIRRLDTLIELFAGFAGQRPPAPADNHPEYLDAGQVAAMLQVSVRSVRAWGVDGRLPKPVSVGRRRLWLRADIEAHLRRPANRR